MSTVSGSDTVLRSCQLISGQVLTNTGDTQSQEIICNNLNQETRSSFLTVVRSLCVMSHWLKNMLQDWRDRDKALSLFLWHRILRKTINVLPQEQEDVETFQRYGLWVRRGSVGQERCYNLRKPGHRTSWVSGADNRAGAGEVEWVWGDHSVTQLSQVIHSDSTWLFVFRALDWSWPGLKMRKSPPWDVFQCQEVITRLELQWEDLKTVWCWHLEWVGVCYDCWYKKLDSPELSALSKNNKLQTVHGIILLAN